MRLHAPTLRIHYRNINRAIARRAGRPRRRGCRAPRCLVPIDLLGSCAGHGGLVSAHDGRGKAGGAGVGVGGAGIRIGDAHRFDVRGEWGFGEVGVAASPLDRAGGSGGVARVPKAEVHLHRGLRVLVVA
jgi:hypothetical protein